MGWHECRRLFHNATKKPDFPSISNAIGCSHPKLPCISQSQNFVIFPSIHRPHVSPNTTREPSLLSAFLPCHPHFWVLFVWVFVSLLSPSAIFCSVSPLLWQMFFAAAQPGWMLLLYLDSQPYYFFKASPFAGHAITCNGGSCLDSIWHESRTHRGSLPIAARCLLY